MRKYLKRDNPTVSLHDELREKLAVAEKRAEDAEQKVYALQRQIQAIKSAIV